ncbi:VPLPA-CTERM sorting domain-containing protein [uncultured Jannaschia sp.]|uniref:VPLPA-CTERM sorting domain-containing protein n=1 Tax=uncultured Jannaschia sp. TaxID=293347 RepID=UPI0026331067|nr:VPLPA-CTERM sorting domain-containing protein [uncultured Jannaschia sp.]
MNTVKAAAATLALTLASPAMAATVTSTDATPDMSVQAVPQDASVLDLGFAWTGTPASGYFEFTATNPFDVYFADYSPSDADGEVTGLAFYRSGADTRLTMQGDFCDDAALAAVSGKCSLIAGADADGARAMYRPDGSASLFGTLDAGTYVLGLYEGGRPASGSARFQVVETPEPSPVPLPAAGLLLTASMAGLGFLKRRA